MGLPREAWAAMRPELSADADLAVRLWNLMGGWQPERLPVLLAVYAAPDLEGLLDRLVAIRDAVAAVSEARTST